MKITKVLALCLIALAVALPTSGCRKKPANVTDLPGQSRGSGVGDGGAVDGSGSLDGSGVDPSSLSDLGEFDNMTMDRDALASYTVYFDFDSSTVKSSEQDKVSSVAGQLSSRSETKLLIEGHCDERGTEEYNRSLGERRALALREALIGAGIGGDRIRTITYGEDRPVDTGLDEAAYAKNRRGEFVLLLPK
jgi:peptidoglycan-associated lipoprotein